MKYRADIDGLRALAVLPVVAFHAGPIWLRGGFVGVDVFFVISGFLITGLILADLRQARFSLLRFYQRRVLRIFPALVLVTLAAAAFGWIVATPGDLRHIGASFVSISVFLSNALFWREAGYFAGSLSQRPLLHTWSLSVEEQFYLLYPLYLLLIRRFDGGLQRRLTLGLWAASFAVSASGVMLAPQAAFYFLPSRVWELLTGGLLAMGLLRDPLGERERRAARWLGLGLIAIAAVFYRPVTPFPGPAALLPVLGAGLVIWAGLGGGARPKLLAHPWLVFLGKVSYPLYLWHLPVIAAVLYLSVTRPSGLTLAAAFFLSLLLAIATWRLIERPIQAAGRPLHPRKVLLPGVLAMGILGIGGGLIFLAEGVPNRFAPEMLEIADVPRLRSTAAIACGSTSLEDLAAGRFCVLGGGEGRKVDTLLWGDSIAEAAAPGVEAAAARQGQGLALAFFYGCPLAPPPPPDIKASFWLRDCRAHRRAVLEGIAARPDIRRVVLAHRWRQMPEEENIEGVVAILAAAGKEVWIVGPVPSVTANLPHALYVQSWGIGRDIDLRPNAVRYRANFAEIRGRLEALAAQGSARIIELDPLFCDAEKCRVMEGRYPLYYDTRHLSVYGALAVSSEFDRVFETVR